MSGYDSDDAVEFLIQHFTLREVEAYCAARDDVRRIAASPVELKTTLPAESPTMPAAGNVVSKVAA